MYAMYRVAQAGCPMEIPIEDAFQIQQLHFPTKENQQRHKQLGYTDQLVTHKFRSLQILGPISNFKIQQ